MKELTPNAPGQIAFKPYEVGSIVPQLQRQKQRDEAAATRYIQSVNESFDAQLKDGKRTEQAIQNWSNDMKSLTQFSQTLLNEFTEYQKQKNAADMDEGIAAAYEQGIDFETVNLFDEAEAEQKANTTITHEAGGQAYEQGNSYETASRVKGLSGWKAYGYSVGRAQMAGDAYGAWMRDALENDDQTILNYNGKEFTPATARTNGEVAAAMAHLRRKFISEFGLGGASAAVLNKYAFPKMHKHDSQLQFERRNLFDKEEAFEERMTAIRTFEANRDLNSLFATMKNIRGEDGKLLGKSGAHKAIKQYLADAVKNGIITPDELRAIGEQEVAWAPGKRFKDHYRNLIEGSIRDARQIERSETSYQRQEKRRLAQEKITSISAEIASNAGMYSKEDIESLIQEIRSDPELAGLNLSLLEDASRSYTSDAEVLKKQRGRLEALASAGLLRSHHLQGIPFQLRQQFQAVAEAQAKAAGPQGNYSKQLEAIRGTVIQHRKDMNGDGSVSISTQAVITDLQSRFRAEVAKKINQGLPPEQAAGEAAVDTLNYFNDNIANENGRYYKASGRDNMLRLLQNNSDKSRANSHVIAWDAAVKANGSIDKVNESGDFLSPEELSNNELLWGTPDWKLPGLVQHIVDKTGRDPLTVLNQFRVTHGLSPLVSPSAAAAQGMTDQGKKLLNRWRSSMRTTRAYASEVMSWDPTRHKYGAEIDIAAQQSGIQPALIAAMAEIESTNNPNAVSPTGAVGLMQIQPSAHPKYKGGMDPQQNLIYGGQYFAQLIQRYGGNIDHAVAAYNMGPNGFDAVLAGQRVLPEETKNHIKKFQIALSKYQPNLNNQATMRGQFEVVQIVSTDPRYEGDSDPRTVRDVAGHGGDAMHQHYEFATKEQALLAKKLYEKRGFRVTSYMRPNDHGSAHQHGYTIDVAPPLDLPRNDEAEIAWIDQANAVIGY